MRSKMTTRIKPNALVSALLSVLLVVNLGGAAGAQEARAATGKLRGSVSAAGPDGQSYNIPGASLKLKGTGQGREVSANDEGEYEFAEVPPGEYTFEARAEGFKTASKSVSVRAGEASVENIVLEVAEVNESVTVVSAGDGVEATEAAPATKVTRGTLQTSLVERRGRIRVRRSAARRVHV